MSGRTPFTVRVPGMAELSAGVLLGIGASLSLAVLTLVAKLAQVSPLPAPVAVAFAIRLLGKGTLGPHLVQPVGLAFHVAYVTGATVAFAMAARAIGRRRLGIGWSFAAALALWVFAGLVFLPFIGWGFFGLRLGLAVALNALFLHLLYGLFLWTGTWLAFRDSPAGYGPGPGRG